MAPCALLVRCASTNSGLSDQPFGGVAGHVEALGAVVVQPPSTLGLAAAGDGYHCGLSGRYRRINCWRARYPRDSFGRCGAGGRDRTLGVCRMGMGGCMYYSSLDER